MQLFWKYSPRELIPDKDSLFVRSTNRPTTNRESGKVSCGNLSKKKKKGGGAVLEKKLA